MNNNNNNNNNAEARFKEVMIVTLSGKIQLKIKFT